MHPWIWIGISVWGALVTIAGLACGAPDGSADLPAHDLAFLVGGGLLCCLIGVVGLTGLPDWLPGQAADEETVA